MTWITAPAVILFALFSHVLAGNETDKRGLCFVPNSDYPNDYEIWVQPGSDLTWYYNYQDTPSSVFSDISQDDFEFVPMMWGVSSNAEDTSFLDAVRSLIEGGRNITYVLGFNEPNAPSDWGGSDISPDVAAQAWVANFEPLADMGVKLGLPACSGSSDGLPWLVNFLGNCSEVLSKSGDKKNCTFDFIPLHWYDNFEGLASHIGQARAEWPDKDIWITEYAYANQDLQTTEEFFNETLDYFDRISYITRYSYFGAFRADKSNVGTNAVFLTDSGDLTPIGIEYLGINGTGVNPSDNAGSGIQTPGSVALLAVLAGMAVQALL